jgi:hypothetical protein
MMGTWTATYDSEGKRLRKRDRYMKREQIERWVKKAQRSMKAMGEAVVEGVVKVIVIMLI